MEENIEKTKFSEIITALLDDSQAFPPKLLRGFSDLSPKNLKELAGIWPEIPTTRKQTLLEDLEDTSEKDTLVCFDEVAKIVIDDPDPMVRVLAIRLLWECEDHRIVPAIIELLLGDPDEAVRSTAASLLGRFVYLGELDEIPDAVKISAVHNLLEVVQSEDLPQVRMSALESLGYSSHPKIPKLIKTAFESSENLWVASALCAMGRSADDQWADHVQEKLDSGDSEVLFEAVRAAGELELASALDQLFTILDEQVDDNEVRLAAIWSLSQIGGSEVKEKLQELLKESESDDEIEWIEKALDNLELSGAAEGLNFLDFKPETDDDDDFDDDAEDEDFEGEDFDSLDDFDDEEDEDE